MEVKCINYFNDWWPGKNTHYTVQIQNQTFKRGEKLTFTGEHKPGHSNNTVKGVRIDDCESDFIPDGIMENYPNMTIFLMFNSKVTKLTKEDFKQFAGIKEIWISGCDIEYLPGNLFEYLPDLEIISIQSCKVKYIDAEILDGLTNLKVVKFNGNTNIDCYHDSVSNLSGTAGITLEQMKEKLKLPRLHAPNDFETYNRLPLGVKVDIKNYLQREEFKDFTLVVDGAEFKVHKFMMAARSKVLAEKILNNPELQQLTLEEVDKNAFEVLLKYIYDDLMPDVTTNGFEIFNAANKLGLDKVTAYAVKNLALSVNQDNALDMLICGRRYGNEILKDNAFVEIKKMFPGRELKDELKDNTDKLSEIFEAKKKMEEAIKKATEEFENMKFFD